MPAPLKIAAVFATMDRAETAKSCVMALARQTRPPDLVMVADNCSLDATVSTLESLKNLPFKLVVHRMPENQGNAGGVQIVMDQAFDEGVDAVWILDDDSWPREMALEALVTTPWDQNMVRHALQIDPKSSKFTWPMWVDDGSSWKLVFDPKDLPKWNTIPSKSSWTGALIPKKVRKEVGPVNAALFIRGEDEEYPWRIGLAGYSFTAIPEAILDHPGPDHLIHWQWFGKSFFFESGLAKWKLYYKVRNMVWLKRRQTGNLRALQMAIIYTVAATMIDGPKRIPLLWRAISDGWNGNLGKMSETPVARVEHFPHRA